MCAVNKRTIYTALTFSVTAHVQASLQPNSTYHAVTVFICCHLYWPGECMWKGGEVLYSHMCMEGQSYTMQKKI